MDCLAGNMWRDGRFNILVRDARAENFVGGGFDAIHVGAAVDSLRSAEHLAAMLRPGGRMVVPVGKESQALMVVDKGMNGRTHEARYDRSRPRGLHRAARTSLKRPPLVARRWGLRSNVAATLSPQWKAGDVTTVPITSVEHQKGKR